MTIWHYLIQQQDLLWQKLWQQIYLVIASLGLAIIIGVPLGVLIAKAKKLQNAVLGFANIVQTIPSLALLALLLPFFGIGYGPAIVALTIYALLPIIRNTLLGINGVEEDCIEAARGLGFTGWQTLWHVELPLALPVLIGGIRTACAISVGIATLAAFIGAGGLGDFILQGIAVNDIRLVLLGAIPAALLAILLDIIISQIEKLYTKRRISKTIKRFIFMLLILVLLLCGFSFFMIVWSGINHERKKNTVVIATKNFTEQYILGEMMAQMIEAHTHLKVIRKFNLGATKLVQAALLRGDVDMYPEYTGTALLTVLHHRPIHNEQQVFNYVKQQYQKKFHLDWIDPFGFENSESLATTQDFALRYHLTTISDLIPIENLLIIGVPQEFRERADGYPGLKKYYDLHFHQVVSMDPNLMYQALINHHVNLILAFTTDGRIASYHLKILKDDKHFFPPYFAAIVIRQQIIQQYPALLKALAPLKNSLDNATMQRLNYLVTEKHQSPFSVARRFLLNKKLI